MLFGGWLGLMAIFLTSLVWVLSPSSITEDLHMLDRRVHCDLSSLSSYNFIYHSGPRFIFLDLLLIYGSWCVLQCSLVCLGVVRSFFDSSSHLLVWINSADICWNLWCRKVVCVLAHTDLISSELWVGFDDVVLVGGSITCNGYRRHAVNGLRDFCLGGHCCRVVELGPGPPTQIFLWCVFIFLWIFNSLSCFPWPWRRFLLALFLRWLPWLTMMDGGYGAWILCHLNASGFHPRGFNSDFEATSVSWSCRSFLFFGSLGFWF